MPSNKRKNPGLYLELAVELLGELDALAESTGRTRTAEIAHAIRRHLDAPPTVIVPALAPAEVNKETKPRRGRRPKSRG